ncbi:MAG: MG2 domain-containing protein [Candidatus Shapirobacteria bacterium]
MKKVVLACLLPILILGCLLIPRNLFSQSYDKAYLSLSTVDGWGKGSGLLAFSTTEEVKVNVTAYKTSGQATVEIYSVTLDDVLNYLLHDNKYHQTNPKIDISKFSHVSDININLNENSNPIGLPLPDKGLFYVKVKLGDLYIDTFVVRSSFGSMAKEAKNTLVVWNQDFETSRSVVGAKMTVYNLEKNKNVIATVNSDNDGIASIPLTESADLVVVESNDSMAILPLNARYLNGAYTWTTFSPNLVSRKYFMFTDRPIYKPGDTVRFKIIVRDDDDARYSMANGSVLVAISEGHQNSYLYKSNLSIDINGFVTGSYTIPKKASTGDYRVVVNPKTITSEWGDYQEDDGSIYFKVENYRKPEYFIKAESSQMDVIRGDEVRVNLSGEYYSGQPLSDGTVNYKIYADSGYYGDYEYYYPSNGNNYYRAWGGNEIDSGTLVLDKKGNATITLPTNKNDSLGKYQVYFFEFTYADASGNQSLSGVNVLVRSGEYSLYRDGYGPYGGRVGDKISVPFVLKNNKEGLKLSQKVEVNIVRKWWEKYNDENNKYPQYREKKDEIATGSFTTDGSGKAKFEFVPEKEGSYELQTKITDSRGNVVVKNFSLWINNKYGEYSWGRSNSTIKITPDKESYRVGDEAIINISSEIPNRDVYLGVERAYQDRYQVVKMNGSSADVRIVITDHDMPNIFLSAKSFSANNLDGDVQNIPIDTSDKKIYYSLSTDKKNYAPGDEVTVNVMAKDVAGNPVESNLALWAVDKSIYALADINYGDVFEKFWQARGDDTQQAHSLEGIVVMGAAEKGGCFLAGTKVLMADNSEKPIEEVKIGDSILTRLSSNSSKMVKTKVTGLHEEKTAGYLIINHQLKVTDNHLILINRKWLPARTIKIGDELIGKDGNKIEVRSLEYLNLPERVYNLTTNIYHTYFADGIYVHNEKGGGSRDNFADTAYWNASINTGSQGQAQIKFKLPDNLTTWVLTTIGASRDTKAGQGFTEIKVSKDLVIRPVLPNVLGESDEIVVSALINNYTDLESKATVWLKTNAGKLIDSETQTVTVGAHDFSQIKWLVKVGEAKEASKFEFGVKDDRGRSDSMVQLIDVRSVGYWQQRSDFKSGITNFEVDLPKADYEASKSNLEITLSSTIMGSLPSAVKYLVNYPYGCTEQTTSSLVSRLVARKYPNVFSEALKAESKNITIEDGLIKLKELQNYDGSWSWWWKGSKTEPFVSAYVFRILNEAKTQNIAVDEGMYSRAQKYFVTGFEVADVENKIIKAYGLAFSVDRLVHKSVMVDYSKLSDDYLAMAVYANLVSGENDASKNGLDVLMNRMQVTSTGIHWRAGSLDRFGTDEASTALALQAIVKDGKYMEEAAKAINFLMKNRYHDYWSSTYTTAQSILAITDYSQAVKESEANYTYRVMSGNQLLASGKFVGVKTLPVVVKIDPKKIINNSQITIEKVGEGEIYTTFNQKWWLKGVKSVAVSNGVTITKRIINNKGEEYNFVPGDLVTVDLMVSFPEGSRESKGYAIIEDHLPSGLIPVNTNLLNESNDRSGDYIQKEYLNDGVIIPIYYGNENHNYQYMARVVNEGNFILPPAYYSLMYYPEVWARSESTSFRVGDVVKINPLTKINETISDNEKSKTLILGVVLLTIMVGLIIRGKNAKKIKKDEDSSSPPLIR